MYGKKEIGSPCPSPLSALCYFLDDLSLIKFSRCGAGEEFTWWGAAFLTLAGTQVLLIMIGNQASAFLSPLQVTHFTNYWSQEWAELANKHVWAGGFDGWVTSEAGSPPMRAEYLRVMTNQRPVLPGTCQTVMDSIVFILQPITADSVLPDKQIFASKGYCVLIMIYSFLSRLPHSSTISPSCHVTPDV